LYNVKNFQQVYSLKNLKNLYLSCNGTFDFSLLSNPKNLEKIDLRYCNIQNTEQVSLPKLRELDLYYLNIDINVLNLLLESVSSHLIKLSLCVVNIFPKTSDITCSLKSLKSLKLDSHLFKYFSLFLDSVETLKELIVLANVDGELIKACKKLELLEIIGNLSQVLFEFNVVNITTGFIFRRSCSFETICNRFLQRINCENN
jgi:hypothetical protein